MIKQIGALLKEGAGLQPDLRKMATSIKDTVPPSIRRKARTTGLTRQELGDFSESLSWEGYGQTEIDLALRRVEEISGRQP